MTAEPHEATSAAFLEANGHDPIEALNAAVERLRRAEELADERYHLAHRLDQAHARLQRAEEDCEAVHNLAEHVGAASARIQHLETGLREIVDTEAGHRCRVIARRALSSQKPETSDD